MEYKLPQLLNTVPTPIPPEGLSQWPLLRRSTTIIYPTDLQVSMSFLLKVIQ